MTTTGERLVALIQLTRTSPARPVSASFVYIGANGRCHLSAQSHSPRTVSPRCRLSTYATTTTDCKQLTVSLL
eukprot:1184139-Prorocentrum_minimum.AAC.2